MDAVSSSIQVHKIAICVVLRTDYWATIFAFRHCVCPSFHIWICSGQHYDPLVAPAGDFVPDAVTSDSADPVTAGTVSAAAAAGAYAATTAASEVRCLPTTEDADWDAVNKAALELAKVRYATVHYIACCAL